MAKGNGIGTSLQKVDAASQAAVQQLRMSRMRRDAWYNQRSKFGGQADPVIHSTFIRSRGRMERAEAEALFEFDWLSRRVCEQMAKDSTRAWVRLSHKTNPEIAEKLRIEDRRLGGRALFREGIRLGNLHGGAVMVLGIWDGKGAPEDPVNMERIQKVSYAFNVDRWLTFPRTWYRDLEEQKYGTPETYIVHRLAPIGSAPIVVHEHRVIRFDGNALPPLARVRNWGWGASVLDVVYDALRNWGMSNQAAASVIPNFITYAMKIGNLRELISNGDWATIQARVSEVFAQMSIQNMMAYGEEESIQKMGTPVAGLPDLLDKFQGIVSGAVNIPKSILFQAESGSLGGNAGGTDRDNWYDTVSSYQETELFDKVRYWFDVIGVPLRIKPGEIDIEFNSLKQLSPTEEADLYAKNATSDVAYINAQVVHPEQVAVHRFGGQKYNPAPLIFDTEREEKILEEIKKQPIEMGSQDQFGIPFSGDPPEQEGEGGEGEQQEEDEDGFNQFQDDLEAMQDELLDNSFAEGQLESMDEPGKEPGKPKRKVKKVRNKRSSEQNPEEAAPGDENLAQEMKPTKDPKQSLKTDEGLIATLKEIIDTRLAEITDVFSKFTQFVKPKRMHMVTKRNADGTLETDIVSVSSEEAHRALGGNPGAEGVRIDNETEPERPMEELVDGPEGPIWVRTPEHLKVIPDPDKGE